MFTRYKGTAIPENYSGVAFSDHYAPPTEMKTHKPAPSYTSTKTSVSPTFKSAQLQRSAQKSVESSQAKDSEAYVPLQHNEKNDTHNFSQSSYHIGGQEEYFPNEESGSKHLFPYRKELENQNYAEHFYSGGESNSRCNECESEKERDKEKGGESRKAPTQSLGVELYELLNKILKGIRGEDLLLLAVAFLILAENKGESTAALLPLILLLLYS